MRVFDYIIIDPTNENGLTVKVKSKALFDFYNSKKIPTNWIEFSYRDEYSEVCRFVTSSGSYPTVGIKRAINEQIKHNGLCASSQNQDESFTRYHTPNMVYLSNPAIKDGLEFTYQKPVLKGELSMFVKALEYYFKNISKMVSVYFEQQLQTVRNPQLEPQYAVQTEVLVQ